MIKEIMIIIIIINNSSNSKDNAVMYWAINNNVKIFNWALQ